MPADYKFVQKLVNFGRDFAGKFVGQPFVLYRLNDSSNGDVISNENIVNGDIRAKVTHRRIVTAMENEYLHVDTFEFLVSSDEVRIGDVFLQNDEEYGDNQNTSYAVASRRPLKPVVAVRVETACQIHRIVGETTATTAWRGPKRSTDLPFTIVDGVFVIGEVGDVAAVVPCGVQSIGQMKGLKPPHLPLDNITTWWYVYVPLLPGLTRLRENDVISYSPHPDEDRIRLRINTPYSSPAGTAGHFLLCERLTV